MQKSLKAVNAIKCALNIMKWRDITACSNYLLVGFQRLPLYSRCHFKDLVSSLIQGRSAGGPGSRLGAPVPVLVMLSQIKRQRGPVEMAAGLASAATGGGDGGRSYHFLRQLPCHYYHI